MKIYSAKILFLSILLIILSNSVFALGPEIEQAIINGRWQKLHSMLKADTLAVDDPISRILMGHACLAIQNNYGATSSFSSVASQEELNIWAQFAQSLAEQHPQNHIALYLLADSKMRTGDIEGALAGLNEVIGMNDQYILAHYQKASIFKNFKNDFSSALNSYNKVIQINPRYARAYLEMGSLYNGIKKHDLAIEYASKAINADSAYAFAYYNRANAYNLMREYKKAILDFDQAIMLRPIWPMAFYNRGNVFLLGTKDYLNAISDYEKAIKMKPSFLDAILNRGIAYTYSGQLPKALADFNRLIATNPDFTEAYSNRGNVYMNVGESDKALLDYNKAIELNPKMAEAYENRGYLHMVKFGNRELACADWKKACELGKCNNYQLAQESGDCE